MTDRVHGFSKPMQALTGDIGFYTLTSAINIQPYGLVVPWNLVTQDVFPVTDALGNVYTSSSMSAYVAAYNAQQALDFFLRALALYSQAIIVEPVSVVTGTSPIAGIPTLQTPNTANGTSVTYYTLVVAVEHQAILPATSTLLSILNGCYGFIYDGSANVNVNFVQNLELSALQHLPAEVMAGDGYVS